jgi:hypothetical protein
MRPYPTIVFRPFPSGAFLPGFRFERSKKRGGEIEA